MPGLRHVWTGLDVDVYIFLEDGDGLPIGMADPDRMDELDTPLTQYCFWQDVNVSQSYQAQRRAATGRPFLKITSREAIYNMTVGHLAWAMEAEWNSLVFNRTNRFTVVMRELDPTNVRDAGGDTGDEQRILKHSFPQELSVKAKEGNELQASSVTWWGEEFTTSYQ